MGIHCPYLERPPQVLSGQFFFHQAAQPVTLETFCAGAATSPDPLRSELKAAMGHAAFSTKSIATAAGAASAPSITQCSSQQERKSA